MARTVVISGTSSGIGRAAAERLGREGWRVLAGVRSDAAAEDLGALPGVTAVRLDLTDEASVGALAERVAGEPDAVLGGLVNNAGTAVAGPVEYLPLSEWRRQFETNFFGHVALTRALLPRLRRDGGRILFTSSVGGFSATPFLAPYNASKFAIEGLADALRQEVADLGVHVAVIQPGATATAMIAGADETTSRALSYVGADAPEHYRRVGAAIGRAFAEEMPKSAVDPDVVAQAIARALTAPVPRTRYRVGRDTRIQALLSRLLGDRAFDRLKRRFMGLG